MRVLQHRAQFVKNALTSHGGTQVWADQEKP